MRLKKNFVPNSVVLSCPYAVVVAAVHRMVAKRVLLSIAVQSSAFGGRHERKAEAITHDRRKGPRVQVEVERRRRVSVDPITRVLAVEGMKASFAARLRPKAAESERRRRFPPIKNVG